MDNVLFYGERDEATRRQVRSAAAAHSHRIGPRKPKAALKPPSTTTTAATTTSAKRRSTQHKPPKSDVPSSPPPPTAKPQHPHRAGASVGASAGVLRPQQQPLAATTAHVQAPGIAAHPHSSPPPTSPDQPYAAGLVSSLSPARPTSSPDLAQRLPQYSWTEYPRYAWSSCRLQSLDMLADAASTTREAEANLPDLRHFERSPDGRPILPPLSGMQQHPSGGAVEGSRPSSTDAADKNRPAQGGAPRYNPCMEFLQHARPQAHSPLPG
ncbi:hypothetical protein BST61_g11336 [Cercospora zeina]